MRLPDDHQRTTIYGQTGSGKTVAALHELSERSYTKRPWLIYDFKGDEHIGQLPVTDELKPGDSPRKPGLYVTRPLPDADDDAVERSMADIWKRGKTGVFVDEGYMISRKNKAFKALLTQGRSREIPVITLSQRPVWMTRFAISEADFHRVFFLADEADRDTVQRFIPHDMDRRLPKFHSYYYDVGRDRFHGLKPTPPPDQILERFADRLRQSFRLM